MCFSGSPQAIRDAIFPLDREERFHSSFAIIFVEACIEFNELDGNLMYGHGDHLGRGVEEHSFSQSRSGTFHRNIQGSQYHVRWDDQCIQEGDQQFGKGVTGKFIGKARIDLQHCEAFGTFCF
jgi:hypothetical protein